MWLPVFLLVAQAVTAPPAATKRIGSLVLEPVFSQAEYCRESSGDISLRLTFNLDYQNKTQTAIVLPMFASLAGYELFSDETALRAGRAEAHVKFHVKDVLNALQLSSSAPDPKLFWVLRPDELASAYVSVPITVQRAHGAVSPSLLGGDHYLKLYMNPWPADRKAGNKLDALWRQHGLLWMTDIPSLPVKFHVEYQPRIACSDRID